jgi:hypothetical protein
MIRYSILIDNWSWDHIKSVKMWLAEQFGDSNDRWRETYDYGLLYLWMDEDIYLWYKLKWS